MADSVGHDALTSAMLSPTSLSTCVILLIVYLVKTYLQNKKRLNPPMVGKSSVGDFRKAIQEGYNKYPDEPFQISNAHFPVIVLPLKYVEEIKSLPENILSFNEAIRARFNGRKTGLGDPNPVITSAVRADLTRNIAKTIDDLQDEMIFANAETIGPCDDWTPIHVFPALLEIVAFISGRVFVGLPLCRTPEWRNISIHFTTDSVSTAHAFWKYSWWTRPFARFFERSGINKVQKHRDDANRLLGPILRKRLDDMKREDFKRPADMIQWAIENAIALGRDPRDVRHMVDTQLGVSLAAIHTTSMNVTHCLYDLCCRPEYIEPLREEIVSVLRANDGKFSKQDITKLAKLDSFIKESQRFNPPNVVSMQRKVMRDITLSDGTKLHRGMFIAIPSDGPNHDAQVWENPEEFDGFRFEKLRKQPGSENKFQFVTTGTKSLSFGHGLHACPGRFFASNEIKILLAYLIVNYNFRFPEGSTERPKNIYSNTSVMPSPFAKVEFKRRKETLGWDE